MTKNAAKNAFVNAVLTTPVEARTENNMKAQKSTLSKCVDLFYKIGASRGKNILPAFEAAYQEDNDIALRIALWARDVRGGAGERQLFRDILQHLEKNHVEILRNTNLLYKVPELGRWDDMLVFKYDPAVKFIAYREIKKALDAGNGLAAKWMPRKGLEAVELREAFGLTPKAYRKMLVSLSNTVEQKMCSKEFDKIEYSHVPSLAMSRYMKAFYKNDMSRFIEFREALKKGETKINASAVYPYDVIKALRFGADSSVCDAQWESLPDYMTDTNVLPMVDVSGSMTCLAGGNPNLTCLDISLSLGLYCADKNKGDFKDLFLTFSGDSELIQLKGSLSQKIVQMNSSQWEMNTNLHRAFDVVLQYALKNKVPAADMPTMILILSDMQFDECTKYDDSAIEMIRCKYETAGYTVPAIVFWNLKSYDNVPVSYDEKGVALVSGFSPAIMKAILAADFDTLSPESIMRDAVCIPRYDIEYIDNAV